MVPFCSQSEFKTWSIVELLFSSFSSALGRFLRTFEVNCVAAAVSSDDSSFIRELTSWYVCLELCGVLASFHVGVGGW